MTTNHAADPLIGRLVDGRYRVRARIARGGMATVYVATDMRLERRIALKVMHAHLSDDSNFQSRFIQEARAAARLADPHVVNVFDQGQDGELAYLVMEYLPGITLRELLREEKRLTVTQAITIMDAILVGLAAAHRAGIVHRDVKPENVLLAEDGRIKIGDFGLARATTANTATGAQLMGTIAYLAPELVTRGTADARSDIYALGIMLYEMLTGEQPYKGEQPMQIAFQHATESVPRPSVRNPGVPEPLDELVLWSTEKAPDDRPVDAQEMLDRLREIEHELGISPQAATTAPVAGARNDSGELTKILPGTTVLPDTLEQPAQAVDNATILRRRTSRRHARGAFLLALVLLLSVIAGGAGWWFGSGPGSLVAVPSVAGLGYDEAVAALAENELDATRTDEHSLEVDEGVVIRSDPEAGERLDRETPIELIVSAGPASAELPSLRDRSTDEVTGILGEHRIEVAETNEYFTSLDAGNVVRAFVAQAGSEDPVECTEGCTVLQGSTAELRVSLGPVPDVVGETLEDATKILTDVGLKVDSSEEFSENVTKGVVVSMNTGQGSRQQGDTISLVVSKGPQPVNIPDVSGWTVRDAVGKLKDLGFQVNANIKNHDLPLGGGYWDIYCVSGYSPNGSAARGTTISLTPRLCALG